MDSPLSSQARSPTPPAAATAAAAAAVEQPFAAAISTSPLEEQRWEVERILASHIFKGTRRYLLKWVGFDKSANSWERAASMQCPDLMADFRRRQRVERNKEKECQKRRSSKSRVHFADDAADDAAAQHEVSCIVAVHTKRDGRRMFKVHWRGYRTKQCSWVLEQDMHADELVERFEREQKARPVPRRSLRRRTADRGPQEE